MLDKIAAAVIDLKVDAVRDYVTAAMNAGVDAKTILDEGLIKGMDEIGRKFSSGELFVPEVLMAANAMDEGMSLIKDELIATGNDEGRGTVVIGTVKGDLHDIGKKLVGMMLESAGFKIYDLGVDVPAEDFIKKAKEVKAEFIGMSAMLTTTMTEMEKVVTLIREEGLEMQPVIGGAPVTEQFAEKIGAKYSHDAAGAVNLLKSLSS